LDDVSYLLHIPIEGRVFSHQTKISHYKGVEPTTKLLGVAENTTIEECIIVWCIYNYSMVEVLV
jgi:hypothetical protein